MAVKARHADTIYELLRDKHGHASAHYACRFARLVWKWAARREIVDGANPWADMELKGIRSRTQVWTREQVAAVVSVAKNAGRPSLGLATLLTYWFGHRQSDVLGLTWTALEAKVINTSKTGVVLPVDASVYPILAAELHATQRTSTHVIVNESTSRPYNQHTFRHDWRDMAERAGIPWDLQFRDLRATALDGA